MTVGICHIHLKDLSQGEVLVNIINNYCDLILLFSSLFLLSVVVVRITYFVNAQQATILYRQTLFSFSVLTQIVYLSNNQQHTLISSNSSTMSKYTSVATLGM